MFKVNSKDTRTTPMVSFYIPENIRKPEVWRDWGTNHPHYLKFDWLELGS